MLALASILIGICLIFYYFFIVSPKKTIAYYQTTLEKLGYKVKVYPFSFIGNSLMEHYHKQYEEHGDQFYQIKRLDGAYDIGIYNCLSHVVIDFYKPELIQEFLSPSSPYLYEKMPMLASNLRRTLGKGVAFSEGHEWKSKRKIMNSVFNYDFIKANIPTIVRLCNENFDRIDRQCSFAKQGQNNTVKMKVLNLFSSIFSNVMTECFFGVGTSYEKIDEENVAMFLNNLNGDVFQQGFEFLSLLLGTPYLNLGVTQRDRDINRRIKLFRQFAKKEIFKRIQQVQENGHKEGISDIIEALLKTQQLQTKRDQKSQDNYDIKQLIDEFCIFYTAGTDTTSHLVEMMIYYLCQNPYYEKKVREQIAEMIKSDEDITSENLKKMTSIQNLQNQTLRMYGPATFILTRIVTKDHYIVDIPIKKGLGVSFLNVASHYSSEFFEDPLAFKPQRWQQPSDKHPYALCGFSGGPRNCIGKHLALVESKIGLIKFLQRYDNLSLPKKDFKMIQKFLYEPEEMELTASLLN